MWDQVLADSTRQVARQTADQARCCEEGKTRKLEELLRLALNSGNMDLAILLFSGLEAKKANEVSTAIMQRMQQLQDERRKLSSQMSSTGDQANDARNAQDVQAKMGDIGAEMNLLQTLLQDIQARKSEAQQMASNFIKSRHDTGMGIIRNMA
jgi:seryl-tRNA synthetase